MSTILDIADAVVDVLNAATLSLPFVAERAYVPVHELPGLAALKVTVVPAGLTMTALSRSGEDFDYVIDVGIQQRAEPTAILCDVLMDLAEEVVDLFRGVPLPGFPSASCVGVANQPIYVPQHLDEQRVFTSVVSLTFRAARFR